MQFYVLERIVGSPLETYVSPREPVHDGETPTCPKCGKYAGMIPWLPPHYGEITAYSSGFGDVAKCPGNSLAVSDRFRRAWQERGLQGILDFDPMQILRIRPARMKGKVGKYFHIAPQRWGTRVDPDRSLIEYDERYRCDKCGSPNVESVRGFAIDERSWTGEDIFRPWGLSSQIVVTERVRKLRDDYGLTNVNLIPTEEYLLDLDRRWTPWVWYLLE